MSTIKVDTIQDTSGNEQFTVNAAWSYNQATPSLDKGLNVSSVTDVATGSYNVNFSITMSDANYAVSGMWVGAVNALADRTLQQKNGVKSTTAVGFYLVANQAAYDSPSSGIAIG